MKKIKRKEFYVNKKVTLKDTSFMPELYNINKEFQDNKYIIR